MTFHFDAKSRDKYSFEISRKSLIMRSRFTMKVPKQSKNIFLPDNFNSGLSRFLKSGWFWVIGILLASVIYFAATPLIFITKLQNGEFFVSQYRMAEDDFNHPRLKLLREREKLDQVIASGKSQFEKIVLLRNWAHNQWKPSEKFYYPPWDAVEILDLARKYDNRGFCAQHAIVFLQACQSMGIHARYVDLPGHFVVGIWSDDFNKWVIMDPSNNIHYEKDGIPLGGRQISQAWWENKIRGIFKVLSDGTRKPVEKKDFDVYRAYSIDERANQLSEPVRVTVNNVHKTLSHESDYRKYPLIGRDDLVIGSAFRAWKNAGANEFHKGRPESADPDDFSYAKNQIILFLARKYPQIGRVKIVAEPTNSETFQEICGNLNDMGWVSVARKEIFWDLDPGRNKLECRVRTRFGWEGPIGEISLFYKPNLFKRRPPPENPIEKPVLLTEKRPS